ncbi:hypothetical protein KCU95_g7322, partial [Aureobasidium melanogenum]
MWRYDQSTVPVQNVSFCNVTASYTHPGQNDTVYVETWLPTHDAYNGRLQAVGGGGWAAGRFVLSYAGMAGAIVDEYATVTTDAGLGSDISGSWLYLSGDNSNLYDLKNFGSTSLGDEGPIYMDMTKQYPNSCELAELTSLAISLCDARDGVTDGMIAEPEDCLNVFDAQAYIGTSFFCSNNKLNLEDQHRSCQCGKSTLDWSEDQHWRQFLCSANGACTAASPNYSNELINYYIPSYNVTNTTISLYDFEHVVYKGLRKLFDPYLGNHDTDLSAFKAAGGKLITYHGSADPSITPQGTLHYYKSVGLQDPSIHDFYRYFKVLGLGHCWGGNGGQPTSLFGQLRDWG